MVTFTYTNDGILIRATSAQEVVDEFVKQVDNGKMFVKDSYRFTVYNRQHSITVKQLDLSELSNNFIYCEVHDIGDNTVKLLSRDSTSFFNSVHEMVKRGDTVLPMTAYLSTGNYSVHIKKAESPVAVVDPFSTHTPSDVQNPEPVTDTVIDEDIPQEEAVEESGEETVEHFDMSVAESIQDKDELFDYCMKFGIKLDKRKSLEKMKNSLVTKIQ